MWTSTKNNTATGITASPRSRQHGVTLIELLITLSVLSLGALISASSINAALPQRAVHQTAEQLVTDLKRARLIAQKTSEAVSLSVSANGYAIDSIDLHRKFSNGVTFELNAAGEIAFSHSFANLGGKITIRKSNRYAVILVQPITGKIERIE